MVVSTKVSHSGTLIIFLSDWEEEEKSTNLVRLFFSQIKDLDDV